MTIYKVHWETPTTSMIDGSIMGNNTGRLRKEKIFKKEEKAEKFKSSVQSAYKTLSMELGFLVPYIEPIEIED